MKTRSLFLEANVCKDKIKDDPESLKRFEMSSELERIMERRKQAEEM